MKLEKWHVGAGSVLVVGGSLSAFLYWRLAIRRAVTKGILEYYNSDTLVVGPLLYFSQTGSLKLAVEGHEIRKLAHAISKREVPLWSFSIPDESILLKEIGEDALAKATEHPQVKILANKALKALK